MISRVRGTVLDRDGDRVEVETAGGLVYEIVVPLPVMERMPAAGASVELRTLHVVREDSVALYGFLATHERELFKRLLAAQGVGPHLALSMMSTLRPERLARALVEKDVATLTQVPGVGRKTAEKIAVLLGDRMADIASTPVAGPGTQRVQGAVQALVALGFTLDDADAAIRRALRDGTPEETEELVRRALAPA